MYFRTKTWLRGLCHHFDKLLFEQLIGLDYCLFNLFLSSFEVIKKENGFYIRLKKAFALLNF